MLRLAVADLDSPSYFVATAAVELGFFEEQGIDVEFVYNTKEGPELMRDGKLIRYFPIGAKCSEHVPLAVVEDLFPETKLDVLMAAPVGTSGHLVLDIGLLEV